VPGRRLLVIPDGVFQLGVLFEVFVLLPLDEEGLHISFECVAIQLDLHDIKLRLHLLLQVTHDGFICILIGNLLAVETFYHLIDHDVDFLFTLHLQRLVGFATRLQVVGHGVGLLARLVGWWVCVGVWVRLARFEPG
jgi:hypothetical protein